ncbi:AcrR family transcriptional regulator [Fulvitalea axinellae]|uniref:AcrR family transcriptional regulator n=1 Tax=Fulvitalea axinellae TaxID=1182444 RepID=A0AAU9CDA2_9BACT|nr:AcrR family transcriptional regulator [Fulvitalea axinellae]
MDRHTKKSEEILETARKLFFKSGYTSITMDDISKSLGMSKKTLYKYYKGKHELLLVVVENWKTRLSQSVQEIFTDPETPYAVKLRELLTLTGTSLADVSAVFMMDIQENVPEVWNDVTRYKREAAFLRFRRLIEEGQKKGLVLPTVNKDLVVALYASAINNLLDPVFWRVLPIDVQSGIPENPSEIFDQAVNVIYEGILSAEAKKEYEELKG